MKYFLLALSIFSSSLSAFAQPQQEEKLKTIYLCYSSTIPSDSISNPNEFSTIEIEIQESNKKFAGRPLLQLKGRYTIKNETSDFFMPALGVPEFIGTNMYHAYFTGRYKSNTGNEPKDFSLVSNFSMRGAASADLDLSLNAVGKDLHLTGLRLSCKVTNPSIYFIPID